MRSEGLCHRCLRSLARYIVPRRKPTHHPAAATLVLVLTSKNIFIVFPSQPWKAVPSESVLFTVCLPTPVPSTQPAIMLRDKLGTVTHTCVNPQEAEAGRSWTWDYPEKEAVSNKKTATKQLSNTLKWSWALTRTQWYAPLPCPRWVWAARFVGLLRIASLHGSLSSGGCNPEWLSAKSINRPNTEWSGLPLSWWPGRSIFRY